MTMAAAVILSAIIVFVIVFAVAITLWMSSLLRSVRSSYPVVKEHGGGDGRNGGDGRGGDRDGGDGGDCINGDENG